jgi:hypothetical protein
MIFFFAIIGPIVIRAGEIEKQLKVIKISSHLIAFKSNKRATINTEYIFFF